MGGVDENVSSHIGVLLRVRRVQNERADKGGRDWAILSGGDHHGETTTAGCPAYANGRKFDPGSGIEWYCCCT